MDAIVFFGLVLILSILGALLGTDSRPGYNERDAWSMVGRAPHH